MATAWPLRTNSAGSRSASRDGDNAAVAGTALGFLLVEQFGAQLREFGVTTHLIHASLSLDERRRAELAGAEEADCVIVSTSALELGLDVGDLIG